MLRILLFITFPPPKLVTPYDRDPLEKICLITAAMSNFEGEMLSMTRWHAGAKISLSKGILFKMHMQYE